MAQKVSVTWRGQQLGVALQRLADIGSVKLWIDRRVDPTQRVDEKLSHVPVREAISRVVAKYELGSVDLGKLIYVGPAETARGLPALLLRARAEAKRSPTGVRRKWLTPRDVAWPRLSAPRAMLEANLAQARFEVDGLERIPHDLWAERQFPQLSLVDQTVLTLVGFDLTCELTSGGRRCKIVPIKYPLPDKSRALAVTLATGSRPQQQATNAKKYSLKLTNQPVGRVIQQIATQLQLQVIWDEPSLVRYGRSQATLVSCEVNNADVEGLLQAILQPAGMEFSLEGKTLKIRGVE